MTARLYRYEFDGGWEVLAGRTDADNDRLSLKLARPRDRWFHVRGFPGSHVVLRARDGAEPDRATLERAAAIAVYHSRMRAAGVTAVTCARAGDISKPRGAPPGTVSIRGKETVLRVRPATAEQIAAWGSRGGHSDLS